MCKRASGINTEKFRFWRDFHSVMFDKKTADSSLSQVPINSSNTQEDLHAQTTESSTSPSARQTPLNHSLVSIASTCRICHQPSCITDSLVSPCRCKGTLAYVHLSCLEHWLNQSSRNRCELCHHRFDTDETRRYTCLQSMRIWLSQSENRRHAKSDLLVFIILTVVTVGMLSLSIIGMQYFIMEGRKIGVSRLWTCSAITLFLIIVVLGYCIAIYLLGKEQLVPWYTWWQSTVNVRLVTESLEQQDRNQSGESFTDR